MALTYHWEFVTGLGSMTAVETDGAIQSLYLTNCGRHEPPVPKESIAMSTKTLTELAQWIEKYLVGEAPVMNFVLRPRGTEFQQKVWKLLREIPYGERTTYGAIAKALEQQEGRRMSAQAVGQAVGHNHILILIPCHRVVGSDGSMTGFGAGIDVKEKLLAIESHM